MKLNTLRKIIIILILVFLSGGAGFWLGQHEIKVQTQNLKLKNVEIINKAIPQDKDVDFSLFWEVWQKLEKNFLDKEKIKYQEMFYGAIKGMVSSLGDPYTVFLPPKERQRFEEDLNGSFGGVGIELGFRDRHLAVIAPLKGTPAEQAGIRAGDLILHLKDENKGIDENTQKITLPEAVEKIRGPQGTKITLTVLHEEEKEPMEIEIIRSTITVPSVKVNFGRVEDGGWQEKDTGEVVAYLQLLRFGENTRGDWDKAVEQITQNSQVTGVILDVRNNPGGYLMEAVNLASEFLSKGVIVKQEDASGGIENFSVNRRGRLLDMPLVVLINKGSASASEILAGALRLHERAELIGEQTFGKGTIQAAEKLKEGAAIHITNARWLLPDGTSVDGEGLMPDYQVTQDKEKEQDEQLIRAVEILGQ